MYKILVKKADAGANSMYSFLTTPAVISGASVIVEKEFATASELDRFVEEVLEDGTYRKTDLRIVKTYDDWKISVDLEDIDASTADPTDPPTDPSTP